MKIQAEFIIREIGVKAGDWGFDETCVTLSPVFSGPVMIGDRARAKRVEGDLRLYGYDAADMLHLYGQGGPVRMTLEIEDPDGPGEASLTTPGEPQ